MRISGKETGLASTEKPKLHTEGDADASVGNGRAKRYNAHQVDMAASCRTLLPCQRSPERRRVTRSRTGHPHPRRRIQIPDSPAMACCCRWAAMSQCRRHHHHLHPSTFVEDSVLTQAFAPAMLGARAVEWCAVLHRVVMGGVHAPPTPPPSPPSA